MGFVRNWLGSLQLREYDRNSFRPGEDEFKVRKMRGEWWYWDRTNRRWVRWSYAIGRLPRRDRAEVQAAFDEIVRDNPDIEQFVFNVGPPV